MLESESEIFYDSLDDEDLSHVVPLYKGETSKSQLVLNPKKVEKPRKSVICPKRTQRSYLTIYYEKLGRNEGKSPDTCRAECGKLSPRRDLELEPDLQDVVSKCGSESEEEQFYEQVIAHEVQKKESTEVSKSSQKQNGEAARFCFKYSDTERIEKLKILKKRQSYGTKMSLKNRIQLKEEKSLRKIKSSKITM